MRDRTPRRTTPAGIGAGVTTLAARQGLALDPFDDLDDLEQQPRRGGVGLDQLEAQAITQAVGFARALADQELAGLVMPEELLTQRPNRDQPVGAAAVEGGEQAE